MPMAPAISHANAPRIIWHFGFQKTGTTAAQWLMRANRARLRDRVTLFPRGRLTAALRTTAMTYLRDRTEAAKTAFQTELHKIADAVLGAGVPVAIVSDENVLGLRVQDETGLIFDHAAAILPVVEAADLPARSEFHFTTRDAGAWLRSAHNQEVKQLGCTVAYADWPAAALNVDWPALQARLAALIASPVIFRDMADGNQPMGAALLRAAGIDADTIAALDIPDRRNESLTPAALEFMLEVNRAGLKRRDVGIIRDIVTGNMGVFK